MKTPTKHLVPEGGLCFSEVIAIDTENATVEVAWSASVEFRCLDTSDGFFCWLDILVDDLVIKWPY